ncbi:hypothetical protein LAC81_27075 [Ensifer adhaerens]|uniref:hypothetical protein n=1 Tax=Ensifer adhaerens TaxID=106592 RepID=UPI001CC105DC|nr:hypothetical protein [Ensifer adhaerens]MBZ7924394.1 hypothetical protein [Ensifer adhaerens]UAX96360.1 hypothetical protein LAC78_21410 [Ensifer adhaerens]UAY04297.1 hypothetical protein LAC80_23550 [Ensifer adhaerens]UAY12283.1 hypothetical protein LAC81_27075 [Ensifer adhaerens]
MVCVNPLLKEIFADGHSPVREIGRRRRISFPTDKASTGLIKAHSPLMADGLLHLDTDPKVVRLAPYPVGISCLSRLDGSATGNSDYIPDIAILLRDHSVVFSDFVPLTEQVDSCFSARVAERVRYFRNRLDCAYSVLDERSVRIEPRLSNLRVMWSHAARGTEPTSLARAREVVRRARLPATIQAISETAEFVHQSIRWSSQEKPVLLKETNLIFTAVMQLAISGEVRLDLGKPFSLRSVVYGC